MGYIQVALGLYSKCIALVAVLDQMEFCFEIWNLNYEHKSWTKQLSVWPFLGMSKRLGFWKIGAFFSNFFFPVKTRTMQMMLYDPSTDQLKDFGLISSSFQVNICREFLIPIKGDDSLYGFFCFFFSLTLRVNNFLYSLYVLD